ncbi:G-protein gamma-like domain [Trinorchestia longiramus]|nr:G-protein gamma-like domain [Trinorchestia longiramus]
MLNQMSSQKQVQEMADQLRREANIKRMNASQAIADLQNFVTTNQSLDFLCQPSHARNSKANPFKEKSICSVL